MFWRGVVGYLPVNIVQGVVGLLAIVLFTRVLTPEQYGVYAVAFTAMNLCHTLVFTWIEAAMARFYAVEVGSEQIADHYATLYRCWLFAALAFALAAALALILWPASSPIRAALAVGLASVVGRSLIKMAQERRRAAGEVRAFAVLDMLQTVGGFLIALAMIGVGFQAAGAMAGPGMIAVVLLFWAMPGELRGLEGGRFDKARAREYAAYGAPIAASLVLVAALATTDRFLLAAFLSESSVGVYHAGYSLANRTLDVLFIWLGMASAPALIMALERGGQAALIAGARRQGSAMVAITLPAAVGLALVARPLADVMIGPALRAGAAHVTPWIAASALFSGLTIYYLNPAFALARRTRLLLAAMAVPAVANIGLNLALIPRYGLDGAMWATTASYALGMATSFALGRRALPLPVPVTAIVQSVIGAVAMALVVRSLPSHGGAAELALKSVCGALVYGAIAFALDVGGLRSRLAEFALGRRASAAA